MILAARAETASPALEDGTLPATGDTVGQPF
jgi:hypothetical protein